VKLVTQIAAKGAARLHYTAPRLIQYGDVKKLTEKRSGSSDLMAGKKRGA